MKRSPTQVFALLVLLFGLGGLLAALQSNSLMPILIVAVVLWGLLKVTNFFERLK
jgi:hypothetical protein